MTYTWNCKALDDYYESTNKGLGCTGFSTLPVQRNGTLNKRMQLEPDTISFNRKLSLDNKKVMFYTCVSV